MKILVIVFTGCLIAQSAFAGGLCLRTLKNLITPPEGEPYIRYYSDILISEETDIIKILKNYKELEGTNIEEYMICQHFDLNRVAEIESAAKKDASISSFTSYLYSRFTNDSVPTSEQGPKSLFELVKKADKEKKPKLYNTYFSN